MIPVTRKQCPSPSWRIWWKSWAIRFRSDISNIQIFCGRNTTICGMAETCTEFLIKLKNIVIVELYEENLLFVDQSYLPSKKLYLSIGY
uniref:Uncharacterized protein n=1 Tax=Megaselia scalaris TaxID=36166 RepID=T1GQA1_MEGSC